MWLALFLVSVCEHVHTTWQGLRKGQKGMHGKLAYMHISIKSIRKAEKRQLKLRGKIRGIFKAYLERKWPFLNLRGTLTLWLVTDLVIMQETALTKLHKHALVYPFVILPPLCNLHTHSLSLSLFHSGSLDALGPVSPGEMRYPLSDIPVVSGQPTSVPQGSVSQRIWPCFPRRISVLGTSQFCNQLIDSWSQWFRDLRAFLCGLFSP